MTFRTLALAALALLLASGVYTGFTARAILDAATRAGQDWTGVEDEFHRRADYATAIAATVEAFDPDAKELADKVRTAQAAVAKLPRDPAAPRSKTRFRNFMATQDALSDSLGLVLDMLRLHPDKARMPEVRKVFDDLELKETHIVVARGDYVEHARLYNSYLAGPPASWIAPWVRKDTRPLISSFDPAKQ